MSEEHPNKKAIQRHWFGGLDEETQERYEDEMIEREFEEAHPQHEDKMRVKQDWKSSLFESVVQKKTSLRDGINEGGESKLKQLFARVQYTKNVIQSSIARHGLGVFQYLAVPTNQTFGESKGCLPGGDEPRNMDKPDTPHKRGHETVSFNPTTNSRQCVGIYNLVGCQQ